MGQAFSLGVHPIGGTYIEFPGRGFNRVCLVDHETKQPPAKAGGFE